MEIWVWPGSASTNRLETRIVDTRVIVCDYNIFICFVREHKVVQSLNTLWTIYNLRSYSHVFNEIFWLSWWAPALSVTAERNLRLGPKTTKPSFGLEKPHKQSHNLDCFYCLLHSLSSLPIFHPCRLFQTIKLIPIRSSRMSDPNRASPGIKSYMSQWTSYGNPFPSNNIEAPEPE